MNDNKLRKFFAKKAELDSKSGGGSNIELFIYEKPTAFFVELSQLKLRENKYSNKMEFGMKFKAYILEEDKTKSAWLNLPVGELKKYPDLKQVLFSKYTEDWLKASVKNKAEVELSKVEGATFELVGILGEGPEKEFNGRKYRYGIIKGVEKITFIKKPDDLEPTPVKATKEVSNNEDSEVNFD